MKKPKTYQQVIGETVEQRFIGTLGQHFGRFTFVAETAEEADSSESARL